MTAIFHGIVSFHKTLSRESNKKYFDIILSLSIKIKLTFIYKCKLHHAIIDHLAQFSLEIMQQSFSNNETRGYVYCNVDVLLGL